ncbi:DUF3907 family protein [Caldalkalibacillus mannanilyticus]|uniref:DUF3907 family protein n=1 Tax=Caldalkalibacillus mannanilyticus TaxID=1418 RepID=UPI000468741C|nr:DUF3907 family protein [Caldalkalibacillus mannanilyticus]
MPRFQLKETCERTHTLLKKISAQIEQYLNQVTLQSLMDQNSDADDKVEEYYKGYLQDLRHLLVNCENTFEKIGVALRRAQFNTEFAEESLYQAYHSCVNQFFYPQNESYEEDGRHSYTGRDAIIFKYETNPDLKKLTLDLSKVFEELRDDLMYYETDYVTKKRMKR